MFHSAFDSLTKTAAITCIIGLVQFLASLIDAPAMHLLDPFHRQPLPRLAPKDD